MKAHLQISNLPKCSFKMAKCISIPLLFLGFFLSALQSDAQVIISPTGDGGFENGTTLSSNGWVEVQNGASAANKWYVGTVVKTAGARGVYVDKSAGLGNAYDVNTARTQYFYKDVTFPAGATNINLSFKWKCYGENAAANDAYDFLRVYLLPTTTNPVAGTLLPAAGSIGSVKYNLVSTTQTESINLPGALAGTTRRLAFCWTNDNSVGTQAPASLDEIALTYTPTPAPAVVGFTPASGCANTTSITITGTNLANATSVTIGGTAVASITSNTATQIVAVIGSGTSGTISVSTLGGTTTTPAETIFTVNSLPAVYAVSGGGAYCSGGTGVAVGLSNSQTGVNYQLYRGATAVGSAVPGTGAAISFGQQTTAGTYTVIATNPASSCTRAQSGSAVITVNTAPVINSNPVSAVKCVGASITFSVAATGTAPTYQWRKNNINIPGATSATYTIAAVALTDAADYDVVVTVSTCSPVTSADATLTVNPLPAAFTVTGGGTYCSGGTGVPVGLNGSETGMNYTLSPGTVTIAGTGGSLSFGNQTAAATYTITAQNTITGCTKAMTGNAVVTISTIPTPSVQPSDKVACAGSAVSLSITVPGTGNTFQWRRGTTNLANGGNITGVNTSLLTINPVAVSDAATDYNCFITNACGSVVSDYASLTVSNAATVPTSQPTVLAFPTVGITSIIGSFTLSSSATNYLVVRRTTPAAPANPVNGTNYTIGSAALGAGTYIEYTGTTNVFTSNGLNPGTTYYYFIYAFNSSPCGTSPLYLTTAPLTGNATTATNVSCGTITTFYWAGTGSNFSRTGKTSQFNTAANWSLTTPGYTASPAIPTQCNNVDITVSNDVLIVLNADAAIYNLNFIASSNAFATLSVEGKTLEINGNAVIDVTTGALTTIEIGDNSTGAGIVDFKANVLIGLNSSSALRESSFIGNSSSKLIFRGDLTLGRTCAIPPSAAPGTVLFDGDGVQQILWNNNQYFANFINVVIGGTNNPIVRHVTGTYTPDNILGNLTVNGSSILDLAGSQWIRDNNGGAFSLNGTSKLLLGNDKSIPSPANGHGTVIPGSNFPGGFTTVSISPNSTVEYNGNNSLTQTIYAGPAYGFLTLTNGSGSGIANKISTAQITISNKANVRSGVTFTPRANIIANNEFNVNAGAILQCGTYLVSGTGSFRLLDNGTLGLASPQGIANAGATGNIRTTVRYFSTEASYIYNGTGALQTGDGLPTEMKDLTIANTTGITLFGASADYVVNGTVRLTAGPFILNGNTLDIKNLIRSSGTFSGSSTSGIRIRGTNIPLFFTPGATVLKTLSLDNNASAILNTSLDIAAGAAAGSVGVGSGATLTTNNNLTLKSNAAGTARVAIIPVNGAGAATGFITGNVTVERYISAQRAWRFLSVPTAGTANHS